MDDQFRGWILLLTLLLLFKYTNQEKRSNDSTSQYTNGSSRYDVNSLGHRVCDVSSRTVNNSTYITANCTSRNLKHVPQDLPRNLREIFLRGNSISTVDLAFFRYPKLVRLDVSENRISKLNNMSFVNLTKLEALDMREVCQGGCFPEIHEDTFQYTPALKSLNAACISVDIRNITKALAASHLRLDTLILDAVYKPGVDVVLDRKAFEGMDLSRLRRLSFRHNYIAVVHLDILCDLTSLEYLTFSDESPLLFPANYTQVRPCIMKSQLISITISNIIRRIESGEEMCFPSMPDNYFSLPPMALKNTSISVNCPSYNGTNVTINAHNDVLKYIPPKVKFVDWHGSLAVKFSSVIREKHISPFNSIQYINISNGIISRIEGPIHGLIHLEIWDISSCGIIYVSPGAFDTYCSLRFLYAQNNKLGHATANGFNNIFNKLYNLELLDLSGNSIAALHEDAFMGLKNLECLYLTDNKLTEIKLDVSSLESLRYLSLSNNTLSELNVNFTRQLDDLARVKPLSVDITGNMFLCDCTSIQFLEWLRRQSSHVNGTPSVHLVDEHAHQCSFPNESIIPISNINVKELAQSCITGSTDYFVQIFSLLSVAGLSFIIAVVSYTCRWRLRYWSSKVKRLLARQRGTTRRRYNAFVAHSINSDLAIRWTVNQLLPRAEHDWDMRLFVWERDSVPGWSIADNIISAVDNSDVTLILVEPAFCNPNDWGEFMLQMALINKNYKLIYLREVEIGKMSPVLHKLMITGYLEWPYSSGTGPTNRSRIASDPANDASENTHEGQPEKLFWKQLKSLLKKVPRLPEGESDSGAEEILLS